MQAGYRAIPTLRCSRFVIRAGISTGVDLHNELTLPAGRMSPQHWVGRHLAGADGTHDERALRQACLVAVRWPAIDVSMDKAPRRYSAERHHGQSDGLPLPWQAQIPRLQITGRLDDACGSDARCARVENVALHCSGPRALRFYSRFQKREGSCRKIEERRAGIAPASLRRHDKALGHVSVRGECPRRRAGGGNGCDVNVSVVSVQRLSRPSPRLAPDKRERNDQSQHAAAFQLVVPQVHEIRCEAGVAAAEQGSRFLELPVASPAARHATY